MGALAGEGSGGTEQRRLTISGVRGARAGRNRARRLATLLAVALLAPLLVAVAGPASPASAVVEPQPIPEGLWDAPTPEGVAGSYLWLEGAEGDSVVGNRNLLFLGAFSTPVPPTPGYPALLVGKSTTGSLWTGEFWAADPAPPEVGYYPNVTSLADRADGTPAFGWWDALASAHQPCATVSGWFAIDRVVRSNGTVTDLDLRFEQSCDGGTAIHGELHIDSTHVSSPPTTIPADLWDVMPPTDGGDYQYIDGEPGDGITNGTDFLYPSTSRFFLVGDDADVNGVNDGKLTIAYGGASEDFWYMRLDGGPVGVPIREGFYGDLAAPEDDVSGPPGITVSHATPDATLECQGDRTGWFAIDSMSRVDGLIRGLDMRWQQRCKGSAPLHGRLHFDHGGLPEGPPVGELGSAAPVTGGVQVDGWALDPETASPIDVDVLVDGAVKTTLSASGDRPEVGQANPLYGNGHGFSTKVAAPLGTHQVCVRARNTGVGADTVLGCTTVTVGAGSPFGSLDVAAAGPASVNVAGWAIDPDTSLPIPVHVYVDAKGVALTADTSRPDVAAAVPGYGAAHGFTTQLSAGPGPHTVCAYGINVGVGGNVLLGCRSVVVPSGSPVGSLDLASAGPGMVTAAGWALDWDSGDPISVHVYVDGVGVAVTANGSRPDVGAAFPGWGPGHGFSAQVRMGPGPHTVCAYGINVGPGANSLIACRPVVVPGGSPFGALDVVVGGTGQVTVAGWAIDPDTSASVPVHVYVGPVGTALTADGTRNDVAAAFPGYGAPHGFGSTITATPGTKQVCAYGINVGVGANSLIGCRTVTVG